MSRIKLFKISLVALCFSISQLSFADAENFMGLENITGVWKRAAPTTEREKYFRLHYHLISRDTALVEVYGDPAKQTTETIFHRDGKNLLATHYCARGNQPRLKLTNAQKNILEFIFQDATNLDDPKDAHMVRMKYTFIDKDHFKKEEVYLVDGKEESETIDMVRIEKQQNK